MPDMDGFNSHSEEIIAHITFLKGYSMVLKSITILYILKWTGSFSVLLTLSIEMKRII